MTMSPFNPDVLGFLALEAIAIYFIIQVVIGYLKAKS